MERQTDWAEEIKVNYVRQTKNWGKEEKKWGTEERREKEIITAMSWRFNCNGYLVNFYDCASYIQKTLIPK